MKKPSRFAHACSPRGIRWCMATTALALTACGGSDGLQLPDEPVARLGEEAVPLPATPANKALPFVDFYKGNLGGTYAGQANIDLRSPSVNPAVAMFDTSFGTLWSAAPNTGTLATDLLLGKATDQGATTLQKNWAYSVEATQKRTAEQELFAWVIDGQNANYAMIAAMGTAANSYKTLTLASSRFDAFTAIPADASTVRYQETTGTDWGSVTAPLGSVPVLVNYLRGASSSGNPAKNAYAFPRAYMASTEVVYPASLLPRKALDGGFPSGHTNAAYLAGLAMAYAMPERYQELVLRASELGESRIWASHHSPVDIVGGRTLATALSASILNDTAGGTCAALKVAAALCPDAADASTPSSTKLVKTLAREQATLQLGSALVAAQNAASDSQRELDRATYRSRLSYALPTLASAPAEAAKPVPKGAEVLLETRFPYLTAAQRRAVLRSTALANSYPTNNDVEGWGRLNLFDAADGYGAFNGDVTVVMNAADGSFSAKDTWRNAISGAGMLTKAGSGTLRLAGESTYSGGTLLQAGELHALSARALGAGLVYVKAGKLVVQSAKPLLLASYAQRNTATLGLVLGTADAGSMNVSGAAVVDEGSALVLQFASDFKPVAGTVLTLLKAASLSGSFQISGPAGYEFETISSATGLQLRVKAVPKA